MKKVILKKDTLFLLLLIVSILSALAFEYRTCAKDKYSVEFGCER